MRCYQVSAFGGGVHAAECSKPIPQGTEVLIKVSGAGVCHSDLHLCDGHFDLGGGRKLPFSGLELPLTLGHEATGEIVEVGPEAGPATVGTTVAVYAWIGCGECERCQGGAEHLCARPRSLGLNRPGAYAEYLLVPHHRYLIELDHLDPITAAPLGCSGLTTYSALRKFGSLTKNTPIVVIGAGGLGLMALSLLGMMGAGPTVVVEIDAAKRAVAIERGAVAAIDPTAPDAVKQIRRAAGGSILRVLDLVGNGKTVGFGVDLMGTGGKLVVVGLLGGDANIPVPLLPLKSLTIEGSYLGSLTEFHDLLRLVKASSQPLIAVDRRPMAEMSEALHDLEQGRVVGRIVLVP